ncbi:MAG: HicB family protein, partial [Firmicutes bacterium]|nr:HicB family protein [Bacillota bacterium]
IYTLVDIDFDEYRRKHDNRSVRKNCTIPSWLNEEAIKAEINFSKVLQEALLNQLNIQR